VCSTDYEGTDVRRVDPAPLAQLLAAWSSTSDASPTAEEHARLLAENEQDGPIHLVRIVAAIESAARQTGGSLARITDTAAVTDTCGGALHHLVEVLHDGGLRAATAAARSLDVHTRLLVLSALRPRWQAPLRAISKGIHDKDVMPQIGPWRS